MFWFQNDIFNRVSGVSPLKYIRRALTKSNELVPLETVRCLQRFYSFFFTNIKFAPPSPQKKLVLTNPES